MAHSSRSSMVQKRTWNFYPADVHLAIKFFFLDDHFQSSLKCKNEQIDSLGTRNMDERI